MTDTTTQAVERCAECTCKDGGIFCNWIVHGDPQVRQLVKDHAALLAERDALAAQLAAAESRVFEPCEPGGFVGDIYYGHPVKTTMGTHRWDGKEWHKLPSEIEALMSLLAESREQLAAAEARARESALEALAAYGQAADAHTAQLAAEAKLTRAYEAGRDDAAWLVDNSCDEFDHPATHYTFGRIAAAIRAADPAARLGVGK